MENFHFEGFVPSDALNTRADRALDRIIDQAPSDATVSASIEQEGEIYCCRIEVISAGRSFTAEASHKFVSIALDKAELNILRKISRWRGPGLRPFDNAPLKAPLRIAT